METNPTRILLVEDNPGDARLIREMLAEAGDGSFEIDWVPQLSEGLERLAQGGIDLVLLDLGLPDSQGLDTFTRAYKLGSHLPFLVLTGLEDESIGLTAVRQGAQDYLLKGEVNSSLLSRAIRYAMERKRTQDALEAEHQRLFSLLDGLPAVVHLRGPDYQIQFANRQFREVFGEPDSKPCYQVLRGRSEPCEDCRALEVLKTKIPTKYEWTHPVSARTYEVHNYPFSDPDGSLLVLTLGIDISERTQAEEALKESERRYRLLAENVTDVIWTMNMNLEFTYVSPSIKLLRGFCPEEVLGERLEERLAPASLELVRNTFAEAVALETQGPRDLTRSWTLELEQLCKDGSTVWTEVKARFLRDREGRPEGILGITRDITERKGAEEALRQSEARLAEAQRIASLGHWEWDLQTNTFFCSDEVYRIFNLVPQSSPPDYKTLLRYVHPDDREFLRKSFAEALSGRKPYEIDFRIILADGTERVFHSQGKVTFDESFRPIKMLGTVQDVTAQRKAQQALRESERNLRYLTAQLLTAQEMERKRISSELHDELGHALLTLKLHLQSIEKQLLPSQHSLQEEMKPMLQYINKVVRNVRRLYLDLSPGDLEDLGLTAALKNLIEECAVRNKMTKWTSYIDNIDDVFPRPIQTTIIYRIFQEALNNIRKHADPNRVSIIIKKENNKVLFTIEDDGKGFDLINVLSSTKAERGLGLAVMKERVRMLGGSLEVLSQEKQGTKINFRIPISQERI